MYINVYIHLCIYVKIHSKNLSNVLCLNSIRQTMMPEENFLRKSGLVSRSDVAIKLHVTRNLGVKLKDLE